MVKTSNLSKLKSEMKKETSLSLSSDASDIFRAVVKGIVKAPIPEECFSFIHFFVAQRFSKFKMYLLGSGCSPTDTELCASNQMIVGPDPTE